MERARGARGGAPLGVGVDQDRGRREQEEEPAGVVLRIPRLVEQQHVGVEHQRDRQHGNRPSAVGPRERPGGQQAERHPADVDQGREEVVAQEEDPHRMEQLGVLRIEPDRQVEDLGEVERADLVVLDEAGGKGGVVPGGVRQIHADVETGLCGHRPVGGDE